MNDNIIRETLASINIDNFYFFEENRKWTPLRVDLQPLGRSELTPIAFLQELCILTESFTVNPLLENSALFISIYVENEQSYVGSIHSRWEILISPKGTEFLSLMNEKLFRDRSGL